MSTSPLVSKTMTPNNTGLITSVAAWSLSGLVSLLAITIWGSSFGWHFQGLSTYQIFPVLGLLAFSIMWSHYVVALVQRLFAPENKPASYFRWTGYAVLVLIVLHPGLLIYQRFRDGFGLPPHSYETYVQPSMAWITLLGTVSLLVFLAFELRRWFGKRSWWKYIVYLGDAAMVAIFYHGLRLGSQTHGGWYKDIWLFYGVSLIAVLLYNYAGKVWKLPGARQV